MSEFVRSPAVRYLEDHPEPPGQQNREGLFQIEDAFSGGSPMRSRFDWRGWDEAWTDAPGKYFDMAYSTEYLAIPEIRPEEREQYHAVSCEDGNLTGAQEAHVEDPVSIV